MEHGLRSLQDSASIDCLGDKKLEPAKVTDVIDGDTIEVNLNGKLEKVRYLMVDTPEMEANDPKPGRSGKRI